MKASSALPRYLIMAALALPAAGCNGCTVIVQVSIQMPNLDGLGEELLNAMYLDFFGPEAVTSMVGTAASPVGGPLNVLATEAAWRSWCESAFEGRFDTCNAADVASAVGIAAGSGPFGALTTTRVLAVEKSPHWTQQQPVHLRSLFRSTAPRRNSFSLE
jgi:hypothetical protein